MIERRGASMDAILRPFDRIRVTRHEAEYPGRATYIDEEAVLDDIPKAEAVVEAAAKALPHRAPFTMQASTNQSHGLD
jgi:hypothetical protein